MLKYKIFDRWKISVTIHSHCSVSPVDRERKPPSTGPWL